VFTTVPTCELRDFATAAFFSFCRLAAVATALDCWLLELVALATVCALPVDGELVADDVLEEVLDTVLAALNCAICVSSAAICVVSSCVAAVLAVLLAAASSCCNCFSYVASCFSSAAIWEVLVLLAVEAVVDPIADTMSCSLNVG
jgi:hypothetical protein